MLQIAKMHGLGNDYIYADLVSSKVPDLNWAKLACHLSDRNEGIGSDGLILIMPSDQYDFAARIFNADGSEAKMCGNGIRCVGKYVYDHGLTSKRDLVINTLAGPRRLWLSGDGVVATVRVDMGKPILIPDSVPIDPKAVNGSETAEYDEQTQLTSLVMNSSAGQLKIHAISMGNPHGVAVVDNAAEFPLHVVGPQVEHHSFFPDRVNFEIVQIIDESNLLFRVWERGSGETMACGTGACAAAVVSHLTGATHRNVTVHLRRGDLMIEYSPDGDVFMTGSAVEVFSGHLNDNWLKSALDN